jgi:hypothetical protein
VAISVDISSQEHVGYRPGEYRQVEPEGLAVNVLDIQRLAPLPRDVIASADLGETCKAGLDQQLALLSEGIEPELVDLVRSRTDEAHVAAEDVKELRKFVQAVSSEEPPHPRNSGIVLARVGRSIGITEIRRVIVHAAELQEKERVTV